MQPAAVAVGDADGDGFDDLILAQNFRKPVVYFWKPKSRNFFPDSAAELSVRALGNQFGPVSIVDVNGDGRNDVIVSYLGGDTTAISTWDGAQFVNLKRPGAYAIFETSNRQHTAFADYDRDGRMDAIITRNIAGRFPSSYLVYNFFSRGGLPHRVDFESPVSEQYATSVSGAVSDLNNDGYPDFFRINFGGERTRVFKGTPNGFETVFESSLSITSWTYGTTVFDFDLDGRMDVYRLITTSVGPANNILYRNTGNFLFDQPAAGAITLEQKNSINAAAGDVDNDGDLDIVVAEKFAAVSYYENEAAQGNARFIKKNIDAVSVTGAWEHAEFVDFDRDGALDLVTFPSSGTAPPRFYKNTSSSNHAWIKIQLVSSNTLYKEAFGARLELRTGSGATQRLQVREVTPYNGYMIFRAAEQHFGLGPAPASATLTIRWPSGLEEQRTFTSSQFNRLHVLTEPARGKLAVSGNPALQATTGASAADTVFVRNVGRAPVTITSAATPGAGAAASPSVFTLAPDQLQKVVLRYTAAEIHGTAVRTTYLRLISDAIDDTVDVPFTTRNLGQQAPFGLTTSNHPFFVSGDFHTAGLAAALFHMPQDSVELISVTSTREVRHFSAGPSLAFTNKSFLSGHLNAGSMAFAAGDITGDGLAEVFISQSSSSPVLLAPSGNRLEASRFEAARSATRHAIRLADLDGDSKLEILLLNAGNQISQVLYNIRGDGTAWMDLDAGDLTARGMDITASAMGFVDGDLLPDLVVCDRSRTSGQIRYFRNSGNSRFVESDLPGGAISGVFNALVLFDANNDGRTDLLLGSGAASTLSQLRIQQSNGTFAPVAPDDLTVLPAQVSDITVLDANLDGWEDVFVTYDQFAINNRLLLNLAGSGFQAYTRGPVVEHEPYSSITAVATDADRDTRPDLWVINSDYRNELFVNTTGVGGKSLAVVPVRTRDGSPPRLVPGTRVRFTATIGGRSVTQERVLGFGGQHHLDFTAAYFGAGNAANGQVEVIWPDGTRLEQPVAANGTYTVVSSPYVSTEPEPRPEAFELAATPNPFNPAARISFTLPAAGNINLSVYSVTGQLVARLEEGFRSAGRHEAVFDGRSLSSGVYLVVLESGSRRMLTKITLLK